MMSRGQPMTAPVYSMHDNAIQQSNGQRGKHFRWWNILGKHGIYSPQLRKNGERTSNSVRDILEEVEEPLGSANTTGRTQLDEHMPGNSTRLPEKMSFVVQILIFVMQGN